MKKNGTLKLAQPRIVQPAPKIKLDISFGDMPPDLVARGFVRNEGLNTLPDGSVEEAFSAYMMNRIPGVQRMHWMDELWRVLVPQGKATIIVPYWTSARSIQDPFAEWPPLCEQSFLYFNKDFRTNNRIYPEAKCDFDFTYGFSWDSEAAMKSDDTRSFWLKHHANVANDLQIVLTKRG